MEQFSAKRQFPSDDSDEGLCVDGDIELDGPKCIRPKTTTTTADNDINKRLRTNGYHQLNRCRSPSCFSWTTDKVATELEKHGLSDVGRIFRDKGISGKRLNSITEHSLEQMSISASENKLRVLKFLERLKSDTIPMGETPDVDSKVFNDPIHGTIELHPLCVAIIDTPQFQRLRNIKQLGACYLVFPGASHNRFEHSIGVCYLAGEVGRELQARQPELNITDIDILCLEIAGLCHDLGHGPFSHLFDQQFIPAVYPQSKWKHEDASVSMFEYLVDDNQLQDVFEHYGLQEWDVTFIKEQIGCSKSFEKEWCYEGRGTDKRFLYEVVANKRNGIDVDKWDYFARDSHGLGIKISFDHSRCFKFVRVLEVEGELQICFKDKEAEILYDMFHTRATLHKRAYQHPVNKVIEAMIKEALVKANDHLKFKGKNGALMRMSEATGDMVAYMKMTDYVVQQILLSEKPELRESQEILNNILKRKLYKSVAQSQPKPVKSLSEADIPGIQDELFDMSEMDGVNKDDVLLLMSSVDYGMKDENPIDRVRFYSKTNPNKAKRVRKDQVSKMLPEVFAEKTIRVYSKTCDKEVIKKVKKAFEEWCRNSDMKEAKDGKDPIEMTPMTAPKSFGSAPDVTPPKRKPAGQSPRAKKSTTNLFPDN